MPRGRPRGSVASSRKEPKEWWEIKDIIDEDRSRYLVQWEPNRRTGRTYPASWVSKGDVTKTAISDWKSSKLRLVTNRSSDEVATDKGELVEQQTASPSAPSAPIAKSFTNLRVEVSQHSSFPREDYPTQPSPPDSQLSPSSEVSRDTQSWHESTQGSNRAAPSQIPVQTLQSIPETLSKVSSAPSSNDIRTSSQTVPEAPGDLVLPNNSPQATILPSPASSSEAYSPQFLDNTNPPSRQPDTSPVYTQSELSALPDSSERIIPSEAQVVYPANQSQTLFWPLARQIAASSEVQDVDPPHQTLSLSLPPSCAVEQPGLSPHTNAGFVSSPWTNMSSMTNGAKSTSAPSPPMQDRVRSIRNSALSSQGRRPNGDGPAASSSRASSVVSEAPPGVSLSDSRLEVRSVDYVQSYDAFDSTPPESPDLMPKHELALPPIGEKGQYFASLPLPSRVKDQYNQTIQYFRKDMLSFLAGANDDATVQTMKRLVRRLNNVSTHVDLENEPSNTQPDVTAEDEAKWAMSSSSKFVVLSTLLTLLRQQSVHVMLVAVQPRLRDILERFLQGIGINYTRTDENTQSKCDTFDVSLKTSIVALNTPAGLSQLQSPDMIIMLDSTASSDIESLGAFRQLSTQNNLTPVIFPIVYCSVGHLSRSIERIDDIHTDLDKLRALVTAIEETQAEVGGTLDEEFRPEPVGGEIYHFLNNGLKTGNWKWTILPVRPVKVVGLEAFLTKELPQEETLELGETPNIRKRILEDDSHEDSEYYKRQRLTPMPEESAATSTTLVLSLEAQVRELQQALTKTEQTLAEQNAQLLKLEKVEVAAAEMEQSLQDYRKSMDELQQRFEKTKRAHRKAREENESLLERLGTRERQHEAATNEIEKRKDRIKQLEADLEEVRGQLASSTVPELAEIENLRQSNREFSASQETLERRLGSITKDFEFTREQYQIASSAAAESALKVSELEEEIGRLKPKAMGEATKLREMTDRAETEVHLSQLARLRLENEELKEQLKRKERGRGMTTRTGSVAPRSPRLGASPARSRAGSRAPGSRPSSPVRSLFGVRKGRNIVEQALG